MNLNSKMIRRPVKELSKPTVGQSFMSKKAYTDDAGTLVISLGAIYRITKITATEVTLIGNKPGVINPPITVDTSVFNLIQTGKSTK